VAVAVDVAVGDAVGEAVGVGIGERGPHLVPSAKKPRAVASQ
jgi:hypothetical protein